MAMPPRRRPGPSARLKLTLSYAGFLVIAGVLLLAVVWLFLLRYVPDSTINTTGGFVPNRSDLQRAFTPAAAAVLGFLLVLGLVGGWFLAGWMLAPLARIGRVAQLTAEGSLEHRVHLEGRADEFRELADVFDAMLDRLESQVAQQKRFAANASHELRTPLAISQSLLEVARRDPAADPQESFSRLEEVNQRAIAVTESLLLLSRADAGGLDLEPVDLSLLAEDAVEVLLPLAERRGVSIEVSGEPVWVAASAALLPHVVSNLVHNAIVHNLQVDGAVQVCVDHDASGAVLRVDNTGEALSRELVATLTEPFRRGAERRRPRVERPGVGETGPHRAEGTAPARGGRPEPAGVGLGLALAQSIIRAHGATLTLEPRPTGGLRATVHLARV